MPIAKTAIDAHYSIFLSIP